MASVRILRVQASNTAPPAPSAWRVTRIAGSVGSSTSSTPVSAGPRVAGIEPYSIVALSGSGSASGSWTQIVGSPVPLQGAGANLTYVAPALANGAVLRFSYSVAGQSAVVEHIVLPATELMSVAGTLQAVRWLATSELK